MKIFISQGMKNKTSEEIELERKEAIEMVKESFPKEDIEVIDSYFKDGFEEIENKAINEGLFFLGKSFEKMAESDVVVFCEEYDRYRGCRLENIVAREYGIPSIYIVNGKVFK